MSDPMDGEEGVMRKRSRREDQMERKESRLSYDEMRVKAKAEQADRRHRHSDSRSDHRHDRHRERHSDRGSGEKRRRDEEYGRSGHKRTESSDGKRNGDQFWSKEAKHVTKGEAEVKEKERPNFASTGKLAEDTNTFNGVVIKYNEPPEARKPKRKWRLYPFKGDESLNFIPIHRQSAYLLGRERKVADIPIDHPSCSKQHAAIQFRVVEYKREDETMAKKVRPYLIDLESSNGTFVNNNRIESKRYYELFEKDVIKFGFSTREYVLLHEQSKDEAEDDDIHGSDAVVKTEPND